MALPGSRPDGQGVAEGAVQPAADEAGGEGWPPGEVHHGVGAGHAAVGAT